MRDFVQSKLLEWLQYDIALLHGGRDVLLLECGVFDYCMFAKNGGGSSHPKGEVALALDLTLKRLKEHRARSNLSGLVAIAAR
jgi:hypothetical protein